MDLVQLFIQIQGSTSSTDFREIDLYPEEPITYTKRIGHIEDPTVVASDFARTFRVPNTPNNSVVFKTAFNVNSIDYDSTLYCNSYINVNGIYFSSGNLRLENVYRNDSIGLIEYEINYYGQTTTFAANVKSKLMRELDLSEYNHIITYANLVSSWNLTFLNGDIVYPLAEWGYDYDDSTGVNIPVQSTLSVYNPPLSQKGFTIPTNPLILKQYKPIIRARYLWDKIFSESGFTYTSNFISNESIFTNLYHISTGDNTSDAEIKVDSFKAEGLQPIAIGPNVWNVSVIGGYQQVIINNDIYDYGDAFSTTQSHFVCPFSGSYDFLISDSMARISPPVNAAGGPGPQAGNLTFQLHVNGVPSVFKTAYYESPANISYPLYNDNTMTSTNIFFPPVNLSAGDIVTVWMIPYYVPPQTAPIWFPDFNCYLYLLDFFFSCNYENINPQVLIGYFEPNYKQIDFIKGINDRFKLVWEPDPLNETNFLITPWEQWITQGATYSWSDKLDNSKDLSIVPLFSDFTRDIKFKDYEEQDFVNFSYFQEVKQTFGQLNLYSNIETISGETLYDQFYSCVPLAPIPGDNKFLIPHFAKDTETQRDPIVVKPRLVYYNGMIDVPITGSSSNVYFVNDGLLPTIMTMSQYPLVSQFSQYPFDSPAMDLNFNNSKQFFTGTAGDGYGTGKVQKTVFTEYWQTWYESTYSKYSRKMTATFNLGYSDVVDLRFNDKIWIKDSWWFPTEVRDYKLGSRQNVTVELVKLYGIDLDLDGIQNISNYVYENICYGNLPCDACCCQVPGYTFYGNSPSFTQSFAIFSDPGLINYASPGNYFYDGTAYNIGSFGIINATYSCATCSCTGLLESEFVCFDTTVCFACCCTAFLTQVYRNGATIGTSTQIWADNIGTIPVTPNRWYHQAGDLLVAFVGPDGFTVTMTAPCGGCNCGGGGGNQLFLDNYNLAYDTGSFPALGAKVACCVGSYGLTMSKGLVSLYGNTQSFTASTSFYFDLFKDYPVGTASTGPLVLSDGEFYKVVTNGTASSLNSCDYSSNCPDRTEVVTFNVNNSIGTDVTVEVDAQISFDQVLNWWTYGSTSSGVTFSNTFTASYEPNSFIHCDIIAGTAIGYLTIDRYIDSSLDNTQTYTTPGSISSEYFRVGTQSTIVNITWADTI
jgi:hypothetical protein